MRITTAGALIFVTALIDPAYAGGQWVQIGAGPSLAYAQAYCDNASMGVGSNVVAWGSTSYVLGAQLGNAIGNAIMQDRFYTNCMVMQGWQKVRQPGSAGGSEPFQGRQK
jgi:hypothetical protein